MIASGISNKTAKIYEYSQEDSYQNEVKFVIKIRKKALLIAEAIYAGY